MNKLNEAAFLRSLAMNDDDVDQPKQGCPDPNIFWALMQKDRRDGEMAEELRNHIAICPDCRDLAVRLLAFHRAVKGEPNQKAEESWAEARPQLNQWIDQFLDQQARAEAEPAAKPVILIPPRRKFFRLTWAVPLAAGMALLAIVLFIESRHPGDSSEPAQIASGPVQPAPGNSQMPQSTQSPDQQLLKQGESGEVPDTILFSGGERMTLKLTSVEKQEDGSYRVKGMLVPLDSQNATVDSAQVTGIVVPGQNGRIALQVGKAGFKNKSYRVSQDDVGQPISGILLNEQQKPKVGGTIDIQVERGPQLQVER